MELDALVFMTITWGIAIGIQTFCLVMLAKHPHSTSRGGAHNPEGE